MSYSIYCLSSIFKVGKKIFKYILKLRRAEKQFVERWDRKDRIEILYKPFIEKILSMIDYEPKKILDLGTGPGIISRLLSKKFPRASIVGVDLSKYMLDYARKKAREPELNNVKFEFGDAQHLKYNNNYFDLIISKSVLKSIPDKQKFFKEVYRVLKPNRYAFITDVRRDINLKRLEKRTKIYQDYQKLQINKLRVNYNY